MQMVSDPGSQRSRWAPWGDGAPALEALWAEGFRSIVQLHTRQEEGAPAIDRKAARRLGLDCVEVDVPLEEWSVEQIERHCREATSLAKPVYVLCPSSGALDILAFRRLLRALGQA